MVTQIPGYKWLRWRPITHGDGHWRWKLIEATMTEGDIAERIEEQRHGGYRIVWDVLDVAPARVVAAEVDRIQARMNEIAAEQRRLTALATPIVLAREFAQPCPCCNDAPRFQPRPAPRGRLTRDNLGKSCPHCGARVQLTLIKFLPDAEKDADVIALLKRLAESGGARVRIRGNKHRWPVPKEDEDALTRLFDLGLVCGITTSAVATVYLSEAGEHEAERLGFTVSHKSKDEDE